VRRAPNETRGRVCLHLCGHDAKHLPPSKRLGRGSNYLFQDKNNSRNLRAAASFPADGETRIILARGGRKNSTWGSPAKRPRCCGPSLGPELGQRRLELGGSIVSQAARSTTCWQNSLFAKKCCFPEEEEGNEAVSRAVLLGLSNR